MTIKTVLDTELLQEFKMTLRIENAAAADIPIGNHFDCGENSMLIQIMDTCSSWWPEPKHKFKETYQFEFLDVGDDNDLTELGCTEEQAIALTNLLKRALENRMQVVVHCHAGICRSGAVVEVAEMMGFTPVDRYRLPNARVKRLMMKELGLTYDSTNDIYSEIERQLRYY